MRFVVYNYRAVRLDKAGSQLLINRELIFLKKDEYDYEPTNFHEYIRKNGYRNLQSGYGNAFNNVTKFLNYIYFEKKLVRCMNEMSVDMVKQFLSEYGMCTLTDDVKRRNRQTIEQCADDVMSFIRNYSLKHRDFLIKEKDLYSEKRIYSKKAHRHINVRVPAFELVYTPLETRIFRDMPKEAFNLIYANIFNNHKRILMVTALGAFGGLRPSEALNVRRADSKLGPGISFTYLEGRIIEISVDLNHEYNLRSDLVPVGKIKKERTQRIYPAFMKEFVRAYDEYLKYLEGKSYEAFSGPLTINRQGKAMTYPTYAAEFREAVNEVIPLFLESNNPSLVIYGQILQSSNISPHILRHYFTARLVADFGEDVPALMYWRGDSSPESALTYIQNKSDLNRSLHGLIDEVFKDVNSR